MRKILLLAVLAAVSFASCKKTVNDVSTEVTVSFPIISFGGASPYYSIPVGGSLPAIQATAQDTFYKEYDSVLIDKSTLDNTTPGLYIVTASARNKYGFTSYASIYVAVTNVNSSYNYGGKWYRALTNDTVTVTKLGTGLYHTNDLLGNPNAIVPAYFVQLDDTTLSIPSQDGGSFGSISGDKAKIYATPMDTTMQYIVVGTGIGTSVRRFVKL